MLFAHFGQSGVLDETLDPRAHGIEAIVHPCSFVEDGRLSPTIARELFLPGNHELDHDSSRDPRF